jgi:hypothetical protein
LAFLYYLIEMHKTTKVKNGFEKGASDGGK